MTEVQAPYGLNHPRTIEEAVERLMDEMSLKDKVQIANMPEPDLVELHPALGVYIRNEYGLADPESLLLRSCRDILGYVNLDADDASMLIIGELWKTLQSTHVMRVIK